MKRKEFLKNVGLFGLGAVTAPVWAKDLMDEPSNDDLLKSGECTLAPDETEGPYPAPASVSTSSLVRTNITEGTQTGVPLSLTLTVVNVDSDCAPLAGMRVDIWHCNIRGYYSAYNGQPGIDGTANNVGTTWLRGVQHTDANGQVQFTTIYPGWYTSRATHIHIQIFDAADNLIKTSQLAFPDEVNTTVNTYYATSGMNPDTNTTDSIFSDSYADELVTITGNTADGYSASREIGVSAGTTGIREVELETGGQFSALSVFPNPVNAKASISFTLVQSSSVYLTILDVKGKIVFRQETVELNAGKQLMVADMSGLPSGMYSYRITVSNETGMFMQTKKLLKR